MRVQRHGVLRRMKVMAAVALLAMAPCACTAPQHCQHCPTYAASCSPASTMSLLQSSRVEASRARRCCSILGVRFIYLPTYSFCRPSLTGATHTCLQVKPLDGYQRIIGAEPASFKYFLKVPPAVYMAR
jgi:hypothetical protein